MSSSPSFPRRGARLLALLWLVLCLAPYLARYAEVGFLSEDFTALVYASDLARAASDVHGAQYDLAQPLFYRPWVTVSLGLESRLFGFSPALLKLSHLAALAAGCLALRALARRLGLGAAAASFAALLAAWFPFGAGSVLWLVGRVDAHLFGFGLAFLALHARAEGWGEERSPAPRRWRARAGALLCCALAIGTKETAFALPLILAALELLRSRDAEPRGSAWRGALAVLPALLLAAALFAWRARCLGTWIGGYAGGAGVLASDASALARAADLLRALGDLALAGPLALAYGLLERAPAPHAIGAGVAGLAAVLGAGLRRGAEPSVNLRRAQRLALASAAWVLLACAPLLQLWSDPAFATNARAYWLAWCGIALGIAALLARAPRFAACLGGVLAAGAALGGLHVNVRDHVEASRAVETLRADVLRRADELGERPTLVADVPKSVGSAYALTFGFREALRPPFAARVCEVAAYRALFPAAPPLPPLPAALRSRYALEGAEPSGALASGVQWRQLDGAAPAISGEAAHAWFARWLEVAGAERAVQLEALPTLELPGFGPRVRLAFLSSLGSASAEIALPAQPRAALHLVEIFALAPILSSGEGALYVPLEVVDKGGDRCWIFAESLDERGVPNGPVSDLIELRFTPSFGPLMQPTRKS